MSIEARVICDSISPRGHRLFTVQCRYPKFIHGEVMTHRVFSRNASSSRAIPTSKYLEEVRSDSLRAKPEFWGANEKGMQASQELSNDNIRIVQDQWHAAAMWSAQAAEQMLRYGAHKQIVNRILEPFVHINALISATEWMNFFGLRLDKAAQPEIRILAEQIWREYNESEPSKISAGDWHLPFMESEDYHVLGEEDGFCLGNNTDRSAIKVSVARCARVSYMSFETQKRSTVEEDLKLYDRLLAGNPIHASPAEHQATPDMMVENYQPPHFDGIMSEWDHSDQHGNFVGWRQYRKMLQGENCAPLPEGYALKV